MATSDSTLKQCSSKDKCVHPDALNGWLPNTLVCFPKKRGKTAARCKACAYAYQREWQAANPDKVRAKSRRHDDKRRHVHNARTRAYRHVNAETVGRRRRELYAQNNAHEREVKRAWRRHNPDKQAQYSKRWRDKRPEAQRQATSNWRKANPGYGLAWRRANPIKLRVYSQRRRAAKAASIQQHTERDILIQYESQRGRCWWCGNLVDNTYHIDHLIPLSRGGSNAPENIVISCPACNLSKGSKLPQEWNGRLL